MARLSESKMPRRDEDDIDVMSGLSVDRDDARYRQQSRQGQPTAGATSNSTRATPAGVAKSNGRPWMFSLVTITLLLVCGVLAFQVWQVSSRFATTENDLSLAIKRIDQLNHEIFATGTSVTQSGTVVEEKFKFFDSEIRKLWDVSYKRNRSAIEQNADKLKAIETSLKSATGEVKTSQTKLSALEKQQTEFTTKLKQVNSQLMAENTTLRATVEDHSEQLLLLRSELEIIQNRLKDAPKDLARRLQANEEAIEAIDAARRQIVSSITQLQNRVNQLQSGAK